LEQLPDDVRFVPNLNFNVENLPFIVFGTLACIHMPVYAYACVHRSGSWVHIRIYAYACLRVAVAFIFQK